MKNPVEKVWFSNGYIGIVRIVSEMGYRCGYAVLPKGHPYNSIDFHDWDSRPELDVHGGITFDEIMDHMGIVYFGEERKVIGFDCTHCDDSPDRELLNSEATILKPEYTALMQGHVWTCAEVEREVDLLIDQLMEAEKNG